MLNPPVLAQALLQRLLPPETRESVVGDLLEEYRESRAPARGRFRANLWYCKEVVGFWRRSYGAFAVPILALFVVRDLSNVFRGPSGPLLNVEFLFGLITLSPLMFFLAGAYGSWRTRRWTGGVVAALGTFIAAWLLISAWWNATLYPFALMQQSNPYWIHAWRWSLQQTGVLSLFRIAADASFVRWAIIENINAQAVVDATMLAAALVGSATGGALGLVVPRRPNEASPVQS